MTLSEMVLQRIRVLMAVKNWRQSDLAMSLGENRAWLSNVMSGRIGLRLDEISDFAKAFGVPESVLLAGKVPGYRPVGEPEEESDKGQTH